MTAAAAVAAVVAAAIAAFSAILCTRPLAPLLDGPGRTTRAGRSRVARPGPPHICGERASAASVNYGCGAPKAPQSLNASRLLGPGPRGLALSSNKKPATEVCVTGRSHHQRSLTCNFLKLDHGPSSRRLALSLPQGVSLGRLCPFFNACRAHRGPASTMREEHRLRHPLGKWRPKFPRPKFPIALLARFAPHIWECYRLNGFARSMKLRFFRAEHWSMKTYFEILLRNHRTTCCLHNHHTWQLLDS
jgi:hypothetical protein